MSRKMSLLYIPPENGLEVEGLLLSGEVEETDKYEFPVEIQIKVENIFGFFNKSL